MSTNMVCKEAAGQFVSIDEYPSGIYLWLNPDCYDNPARYHSMVMEMITARDIREVDYTVIDEMFEDRVAGRMKIAPGQDELCGLTDIAVTVSGDGMEAAVSIPVPFGRKDSVTVETIKESLARVGVVYGIMENVIERITRGRTFNTEIVVAKGTPPSMACDGKAEFYFDTEKRVPHPAIDEEGNVHYKELDMFQSVGAGQPLALKIQPPDVTDGTNVFGEKVPARHGKSARLGRGMNTAWSKDNPDLLVAEIAGQPKLIDGKVHVYPAAEIYGNVDYSTGNITFSGTVHIHGSVMFGFSVNATEDIIVDGLVDGAELEAGGDIVVKKGIVGQDKSRIIAGGKVITSHIDKAYVYAEKTILVEESIVFSEVNSEEDIILNGRKGCIIGGVARAGKSVFALQLGAKGGPETVVQAGVSPKIRRRLAMIEGEIAGLECESGERNKALSLIERRIAVSASSERGMEQSALVMRNQLYMVMNRLRACHEKKNEIENMLMRHHDNPHTVNVSFEIFPNAIVVIGPARFVCPERLEFTTFILRDGRIECIPCEPCDR